MQKILVIKLGALGDFILTTGMMKAIRKAYPEAHITLLTGAAYQSLARKSGFFDDIEIDNRTHRLQDWIRICKKILADQKWDMIFDLQISSRTRKKYYPIARFITKNPINWALWCKGGFTVKSSPQKMPFWWGKTTFSNLKLSSCDNSLDFCYGTYQGCQDLPEKYVLLIPGCSAAHPYKRWPAKFYAQVAKVLAEKGIYSLVIGTNDERKEIQEICEITPKALNFCNKSKLLDIPDLAHRASAVIGNDTGPMHMAELTDTPCFTLYCDRTKQAALQRPNVTNFIGQNIQDISAEDVLTKLLSVL